MAHEIKSENPGEGVCPENNFGTLEINQSIFFERNVVLIQPYLTPYLVCQENIVGEKVPDGDLLAQSMPKGKVLRTMDVIKINGNEASMKQLSDQGFKFPIVAKFYEQEFGVKLD